MHPLIKTILYGLSIFVIYIVLILLIRLIVPHTPTGEEYFGLFSKKDLLLGLGIAIVLTFTHERKKNLK